VADKEITMGQVDIDRVSSETRAQIAKTDDISFKLLGLVPLVSGAGLLTLALGKDASPLAKAGDLLPMGASVLILLAFFAAFVTLGLFHWELRNVQQCKWLWLRLAEFERPTLSRLGLKKELLSRPKPPRGIGKEKAEKFIYCSTIFTWLAVPVVTGSVFRVEIPSARYLYFGFATAIALATIATAAFVSTSVKAVNPQD